MKHIVKVDGMGRVELPEEVLEALGIIQSDPTELVWDLTDVLTNDKDKQSYTAATLSKLNDYEHEEKFRHES